MTEAQTEKQAKDEREKEMIEEIRNHLQFLDSNLSAIPEEYVSANYKDELRGYISQIRWFCSHKYWRKEDGDLLPPPISHIYNMVTKKNNGIGWLTGQVAGPRLSGWTRHERQCKEMLKACLIRAIHYHPPPEFHPEWQLPKDDPRNTHPAAVRYREEKQLEVEQSKKDEHAEHMRKVRKKERLEKEAVERAKVTKKQREERKKHFEAIEEEKKKAVEAAKKQREKA
jgi:hypothetical protein